jgi:hypothetical protein
MFFGQARFSGVSAMTAMRACGLTLEQVVPMVTSDLSQISIFGLICENRMSKNQSVTTSKKLANRSLRQIPPKFKLIHQQRSNVGSGTIFFDIIRY